MAFVINDYKCINDHVTEHFTKSVQDKVFCPECGHTSTRIISGTSFKLDHTFAGESLKWARRHEKAAKQQ
jgi:Zn finger protein HypA/HybF involved in hydrogenase expression